jgi:hypothetical protein
MGSDEENLLVVVLCLVSLLVCFQTGRNMSGGSIDYAYRKIGAIVNDIHETIREYPHYTKRLLEYANALAIIAKALHDTEWVLSEDYGRGDDDKAYNDFKAVFREDSYEL